MCATGSELRLCGDEFLLVSATPSRSETRRENEQRAGPRARIRSDVPITPFTSCVAHLSRRMPRGSVTPPPRCRQWTDLFSGLLKSFDLGSVEILARLKRKKSARLQSRPPSSKSSFRGSHVRNRSKCPRVNETLRDSLFHSFRKQSADETGILTTGGPAAEIAISQIFFFLIFAKISTEPKSQLFKRPLGEILLLTRTFVSESHGQKSQNSTA